MRKILLSLLIIFLLSGAVLPQSTHSKKKKNPIGYAGLSIGPSIPLSDFARDDVILTNSGYAKVGYNLELQGGIYLGRTGIAIGAMGFFNYNKTNIQPYIDNLQMNYPGANWDGNALAWNVFGGLGGFTFEYPLSPKLSVELRALLGYLTTESPEINISQKNQTVNNEFKISSSSSSSVAYLFSAGIKYPLQDNVFVTGSIEYLKADPSFDKITKTVTINSITTTTFEIDRTRTINVINIKAGFRLYF